MGTGSALTSFLQLPGGGWYDNYRSRKSPQGIRPITKSGIFWGTDAELEELLFAWRALLGTRAKLTIELDTGHKLWQWARLQNIDTPRTRDNKGGWLPFTFTWITASQNWRGLHHDSDMWKWGDGRWKFGDGSVAFGIGGETHVLSAANPVISVYHAGSIDAPNILLRLDLTGAWQALTISNETTAQTIAINRTVTDSSPWLEIDAGAHSMYVANQAVAENYVAYRYQNTLNVRTTGSHGLDSTMSVRLSRIGPYGGTYYPVTSTDYENFTLQLSPYNTDYGHVYGGLVQGLTDLYARASLSDLSRWFVLAPGYNQVRLTFVPFPTSAVLGISYDDHYG